MGQLAVGEKNKMLDAICGRTAFAAEAAVYAQLHTADPGVAGTTAVAGNTVRQLVAFGAAAAAAAIASTGQVQWTNVSTAETYAWVSFWSASTGGTFLGKDDLPVAQAVSVGNTFTIASGDISFALNN